MKSERSESMSTARSWAGFSAQGEARSGQEATLEATVALLSKPRVESLILLRIEARRLVDESRGSEGVGGIQNSPSRRCKP